MFRSRPIWIETRVPARLSCPECKAKDRTVLDPNSAENSYQYTCEVCGVRSRFTLAELNDPTSGLSGAHVRGISA